MQGGPEVGVEEHLAEVLLWVEAASDVAEVDQWLVKESVAA